MTRGLFPVLVTLMPLLTLSAVCVQICAEQEVVPKWTHKDSGCFVRVAVSADGNYICVGTNDTGKLFLFQGNVSLWNYTVGNVHSISMSSDGRYIAVGAGSSLYLFDREDPLSPKLSYLADCETSIVALSSDGKYVVIGAMANGSQQNAESKIHVFERGQSQPSWTQVLPGDLESLSISDNGGYIAVSTSLPGVLYLFAREQKEPLWSYNFGDRSGGVRISNDGGYIVATGGNQSDHGSKRVVLFYRQNSTPRYMKVIPEIPSYRGVSLSSNGSVFVVSYATRNDLVLFDMNIRPYSPESIRNTSLPAKRVSMTMSLDGRHIFVGSSSGMFIYEYLNNALSLKEQYTTESPAITDIACSADGRYIVTSGSDASGTASSQIDFFEMDSLVESGTADFELIIIGVTILVAGGFIIFMLYKGTRPG